MPKPREIKRGEIYWVDWNPSKGSEQAGVRPALIIQNDVGNEFSPNTIIAAITSAVVKPYPFVAPVTPSESGLDRHSTVDLASIITISKTRLRNKCGELSPAKMLEVDSAIKESLGLK